MLYIDFETYWSSEVTLSKLPVPAYVYHQDFMVHCMGYAFDDEQPQIATEDEHIHEIFLRAIREGHDICAHNMLFDGFVVTQHYGVRPAGKFIDTKAMAKGLYGHLWGSASLETCAQKLLGVGKLKDVVNQTKGLKELSPELMALLQVYCKRDVTLMRDVYKILRPQISDREMEVIHQHCVMALLPVLELDLERLQEYRERLLAEREELFLEVAPLIGGESMEEVAANLRKDELLAAAFRELGVEPPRHVTAKGNDKYDFRSSSPAFYELLDHECYEVQRLAEARVAANSSIHLTRADRMLQATGDGRTPLPVPLTYYAAHTGRSGGTWKYNMQNLPRDSGIRDVIRAPKRPNTDYTLVIADSAQIEARFTAWLAGEDELVEIFATGGDPYAYMASRVYGREITKENDPEERQFGKAMVLGLGFGMGSTRFFSECRRQRLGLSRERTDRAHKIYRMTNRRIVTLWREYEEAMLYFLGHPDLVEYQPRCLSRVEGLYLERHSGEICVHMPNGMRIWYPGLRAVITEFGRELRYGPEESPKKLFGGKLVENLVQALCRTIVFYQILAVLDECQQREHLRHSCRLVLMVHDEGDFVVPRQYAEELREIVLRHMNTPPSWAPGLPVAAEVQLSNTYAK